MPVSRLNPKNCMVSFRYMANVLEVRSTGPWTMLRLPEGAG